MVEDGLQNLLGSDTAEHGSQLHRNTLSPGVPEVQSDFNNFLQTVYSHNESPLPNGAISGQAISAALDAGLNAYQQAAEASSGSTADASATGRIGPEVVTIDQETAQGDFAIEGLRMESLSNFSSARATAAVFKGAWMYEVTLGTAGIQQLGWATADCPFDNEEGVGDAPDSYAWDGKRVQRWNVTNNPYGSPWAAGDVIGVCLDLDKAEISFVKNGINLGVAFQNVRRWGKGLAYWPAFSVSHGECCHVNFGGRPLLYPQPGFQPMQAPPPPSTIAQAKYLLNILRCCSGVLPKPPLGSFPLPSSQQSRDLGRDDRTIIMAGVAARLAPLLCVEPPNNSFLISAALLPALLDIAKADARVQEESALDNDTSDPEGHKHTLLASVLTTMGEMFERFELKSCFGELWQQLAAATRCATLDPQNLRHSGAYWPLTLACAVIREQRLLLSFVDAQALTPFFCQVEDALSRRQPTAVDLKALLPKVWLPGIEVTEPHISLDKAAFETAQQQVGQAVTEVEEKQLMLCTIMQTVLLDDKGSETGMPATLFGHFIEHLVWKNIGMLRNVPPQGVSDPGVLMNAYFALLYLLQPLLQPAEGTRGASFDAGKMFCQGLTSQKGERMADRYSGQQRLGGTVTHILKEAPLDSLDMSPLQITLFPPETSAQPSSQDKPLPIKWNDAELLLDRALLLFRLGAVTCFKAFHQNAINLESSLAQLADIRKQQAAAAAHPKGFPPGKTADFVQHLQEAQNMFTSDAITAKRSCTWQQMGLYSGWKPGAMIAVSVHSVKVLLAASERGQFMLYVPELYVEALVDAFQALNLAQSLPTQQSFLHLVPPMGRCTQDIITFLVKHFSDSRIVNPDLREELLQLVGKLLSGGPMVAAFEGNEAARSCLMGALLLAFDQRSWVAISSLLLRLTRGDGFGQPSAGAESSSSLLFRKQLKEACQQDPDRFAAFLNRLFNTLNWTITEFIAVLKEVLQQNARRPGEDSSAAPRRAAVMFDLSIQLARLLEFLAAQIPTAFSRGSNLNLTRLMELQSFILSHTAGQGSTVLEGALALELRTWKKLSRAALLAPLVGIMAKLYQAELADLEAKKQLTADQADELPDESVPMDAATTSGTSSTDGINSATADDLITWARHRLSASQAAQFDAAQEQQQQRQQVSATEISQQRRKSETIQLLKSIAGEDIIADFETSRQMGRQTDRQTGGESDAMVAEKVSTSQPMDAREASDTEARRLRRNSVTATMIAAESCPMDALQAAADIDWAAHAKQHGHQQSWYANAEAFRRFVNAVREGREAEAARAAADTASATEAPDEFLDPLLATMMQDPVILPDSNLRVERSTIERHLMSSKTDPFNRSPLTLDQIRPDHELRARIEQWQAARLTRQ